MFAILSPRRDLAPRRLWLREVVGRAQLMAFNRSVWWGLGGAVGVTFAGWLALSASKALTDVSTSIFLSLGLNPREEGLWCVLLFLSFNSVVGFLIGRGVHLRSPSA